MNEATIYALIGALADGQVYPYVVPLNAQGEPDVSPPWVVFSLPTDAMADVLCGQAESTVSVQVDVYSPDIDEARSIRDQALTSLSVLGLENINKFPLYEQETRLHRASLEASVIV
ncbi:tail completion protein gp17 [Phytobacter diazotrophicus]|uniref:tail completion protein gp17 n=1 Tax=Phytobacter diazotrophicus TaxID=395631 RepID=UPI002FEEE827